ncbi:MAG: hypothetical protein LKJ76_03105 [Lachnospiraceae bacterium]|nr:hypothetical protein [Lachnospiraceae bacterium]
MTEKKRTAGGFGLFEAVFDICYLGFAFGAGFYTLSRAFRTGRPALYMAGLLALLLGSGDAFHLVPRVASILSGNDEKYRRALGVGKLVTSITMTLFYILLMQFGLTLFPVREGGALMAVLWVLAAVRIVFCLLPQNDWTGEAKKGTAQLSYWFGIYRNIPFTAMGIVVCVFYILKVNRAAAAAAGAPGMEWMWLAIVISFACYLAVVLGADRHPKLGMLMMPKTLAYVWILILCARI